MADINLNDLLNGVQVSLSRVETDGERKVRLGKEIVVFSIAVVVVVVVLVWAVWMMFHPNASSSNRRIAQTIFVSVVSGLVGYLIKR